MGIQRLGTFNWTTAFRKCTLISSFISSAGEVSKWSFTSLPPSFYISTSSPSTSSSTSSNCCTTTTAPSTSASFNCNGLHTGEIYLFLFYNFVIYVHILIMFIERFRSQCQFHCHFIAVVLPLTCSLVECIVFIVLHLLAHQFCEGVPVR